MILGDPKEIMKGYSKITGTSPMMPKWSLGFMNFEWDINESELSNNVNTYRAKDLTMIGRNTGKIIMVNSPGIQETSHQQAHRN